ncbi:MAG: mannose-1-phosphate guanylyltransferase, partial [Mesorhizobium sp.]
ELYAAIPSTSIDYAIMERASHIAMVPAGFRWNDLGSWQSLLDVGPSDEEGNVIVGDVVAIDCENSYIRSDSRLLSAIGLKDVAIVHHWLFEETVPLWSTVGVDERHGGFHEALGFDATPLMKPKRMRTMARQVYAFAVAKARGWDGPADRLISHGIEFMNRNGRTDNGGWVRTLNVDGTVADATEDAYDHSCVLLALAHAHMVGNADALRLGEETFSFLDAHLEDHRMTGFLETSSGAGERRSNPHMHLLEAFLAWHQA